jgi:glutathione S-transferase
VLEDGLAGAEYLVDNTYSVADINVYPWIKSHVWAGVDLEQFPRLAAWVRRIDARPAVQKGLLVPTAATDKSDIEEESYKLAREWIQKGNEELAALKSKV